MEKETSEDDDNRQGGGGSPGRATLREGSVIGTGGSPIPG